ncbi:U-box domain-containing protein [Thalictrum thalictroides]|uniref:RING-type E3 ubiquitin transferase n=1 Tax=Thalictrum thalictroides TaxID=46969 RepID=A0A7J6WY13_THATH|nr:U-box domain-containing protein [Thalictrum thalictroides]
MQNESVSISFHELMVDLSTLLDIFPLHEFNLNEDVREMVLLIRKQCWEKKAFVDPTDKNLRFQVSKLLDQIKNEIVPDHSKLKQIFQKLGLKNSKSCEEEIESLEDEVQNQQVYEKSTAEIIGLIGLVRYAKCVLFGASTPRSESSSSTSTSRFDSSTDTIAFPVDFRCPISLDLMRDPVVVATGQTYDRSSINHWIDSGHNTCPKTGQVLAHTNLISNRALKNLIALWCRDQKIPFEVTETNYRVNGSTPNKAAFEATKMTALFLVNKLSASPSTESANGLVYELRLLAKTDSENRACIAEAGTISALVRYLMSNDPNLQINAVTTILNLSLLESNKKRIMETNGVIDGITEVLRSGATWEAKENAAATIFIVSGVPEYRKKLGKKARVVKGLMELAKDGPGKKDALLAILNFAVEREAVGRLIEGGAVDMAIGLASEFPEEAMAIIAAVAKRGGVAAVVASFQSVRIIGGILRDGPEAARESAVAGLVSVCRRGGPEVVAELASMAGIERSMWELMATGTLRARRKSASLMRIIRRWAAGLENQSTVHC